MFCFGVESHETAVQFHSVGGIGVSDSGVQTPAEITSETDWTMVRILLKPTVMQQ